MTLQFHIFFSVFQDLRTTCRRSITLLWAQCCHRGQTDSTPHSNGCHGGMGSWAKVGRSCCLFNRNMSKELFLKGFIQISPSLTILFKLKIFSCLVLLPSPTYTPAMPLFFSLVLNNFQPYFVTYFVYCLSLFQVKCNCPDSSLNFPQSMAQCLTHGSSWRTMYLKDMLPSCPLCVGIVALHL